MPWKEVSIVSQRKEFVEFAQDEQANIRELSRRFGISPMTGYKWKERYAQYGDDGLLDISRRPHSSPNRTSYEMEQRILELRDSHPAWGGRKIRRRLMDMGHEQVPSPSTITAILKRNGRIDGDEAVKHKAFVRFEHDAPNQLWQMDFKGHFPTDEGRCHPLTVLDDHSRFSLGLEACHNELGQTVEDKLKAIFRMYGLPQRMLMDNGPPWSYPPGSYQGEPVFTTLEVWLMRLGVDVSHGRPYHPQTQGKDERFHRTLMVELIQGRTFTGIEHCQIEFDKWRHIYNFERPHQALGLDVPASRYSISKRTFPEKLHEIEYGTDDQLRKVQGKGEISFQGLNFKVGVAFKGHTVAIRPTTVDGLWNVFYSTNKIAQIDLRANGSHD